MNASKVRNADKRIFSPLYANFQTLDCREPHILWVHSDPLKRGFRATIRTLRKGHVIGDMAKGYVVYLLINILCLWDFVEGLRTKEELAGRLSIGISIGELNRRMADEFGSPFR